MEISSEVIELRMEQIAYHLVDIIAFTQAEHVRQGSFSHDLKFSNPSELLDALQKPGYWKSEPAMLAIAERIRDRLRVYLVDLSATYSPNAVRQMEKECTALQRILAGEQQKLDFWSPEGVYPPAGAPPVPGGR